jgi:hypothetical protein
VSLELQPDVEAVGKLPTAFNMLVSEIEVVETRPSVPKRLDPPISVRAGVEERLSEATALNVSDRARALVW